MLLRKNIARLRLLWEGCLLCIQFVTVKAEGVSEGEGEGEIGVCNLSSSTTCTFKCCPFCFLDAAKERLPLMLQGPDKKHYDVPLRIARPHSFWDSQSVLGQLVGFLASEKLGIAVTYTPCEDELHCVLALNNCLGWENGACIKFKTATEAENASMRGYKLHVDPLPDIFVVPEVSTDALEPAKYEETELVWETRESVVVGALGATTKDGFYVSKEAFEAAWNQEQLSLSSFQPYTTERVLPYVTVPEVMIADNIKAEDEGCNSENAVVHTGMEFLRNLSWVCKDSWWLTPACAAVDGDWRKDCFALLDDDWGYIKPELYTGIAKAGMRAAKLTVGYERFWEIIYTETYNTTFCWWNTDTQFLRMEPIQVAFPKKLESSNLVLNKLAWQPVLDGSDQLKLLLTRMMLNNVNLDVILEKAATYFYHYYTEDFFFERLACAWLQENEEIWEAWLPSPRLCGQGEAYNVTEKKCKLCRPGRFSKRFDNGTRECQTCGVGTFTPIFGSRVCKHCPAGRFSLEVGVEECTPCPTGKFNGAQGQTGCKQCGAASGSQDFYVTFQKLEVGGEKQLVPISGATAVSDCGCMATTMPETPGSQRCIACGEGLNCRGKSDVLVIAGYSSEEPISIYRCRGNEQRCPGGRPGDTCNDGHKGVACFECEPGYFPEEDGTCSECEGTDIAPFIVVCCIVLVLLCLVYHVIDTQDHTKQSHVVLLGFLSISVAVTVLQQLGVTSMLCLDWPEPLKSLLNVIALLSFNFKVLRVDCIASTTPLGRFMFKALSIVVIGVAILIYHTIIVIVRHRSRFSERSQSLVCSIGTIFATFYISVASTVLGPMQCVSNPNGKMTAQLYQSTVCWEGGEHSKMVFVGAFASLMPIAFLAWCAWAIIKFPRQMLIGNMRFLHSYAFLFFRCRAEVYWYFFVHLVRSLLIALAPVIPQIAAQILGIQSVLFAQLFMLVHFKPWRIDHINILETAFTICVLMFLSVAALLSNNITSKPLAIFAMVMLITVFLLVPLYVWLAAFRWWKLQSQKPFMHFICHVKVSSGSLARLLKMHLKDSIPKTKKVFIDCDDLRDLDKLFDYVGSQTDKFVILMSKDIFSRPWCMGELVTCKLKQLSAVPVLLADFAPPADEFVNNYESYISGVSGLARYGIDVPMIQEAILWILSQPSVALPALLSQNAFMALSTILLKNPPESSISIRTPPDEARASEVGILAKLACQNALCTALVLSKILFKHFVHRGNQRNNHSRVPAVLYQEEPHESLQVVLVMCTNGAFQSPQFLKSLLEIAKLATIKFVPILADEFFRFPTQHFVVDHRPMAAQVHDDPDGLLKVVMSLFQMIASVFQPEQYASTESVLETKAMELSDRLCNQSHLHTLVYVRGATAESMSSPLQTNICESTSFRESQQMQNISQSLSVNRGSVLTGRGSVSYEM